MAIDEEGSDSTPLQVRLLLALVLGVSLAALLWPRAPSSSTPLDAVVIDEQGRDVSLAQEMDGPTLVHFWGSYCPPCLVELPYLLAYEREARAMGLRVLLVAVADQPAAARRLLGPADVRLLFDPVEQAADIFGTGGLPESFLVVRGEVVERFVGATDWSDPGVRALIAQHL